MKIIINTNLGETLEIGDKKAINNWDRVLTKKEMIEKFSLRDFEPKKNAKEKLDVISQLINEDSNIQLQVLNLDIRGRKRSVEFKDIWDEWSDDIETLNNIAFVFKLSKTFLNESNAFIFFTKIENIDDRGIEISINRVEYMNIPFLEKNINAVYNNTINLDFSFDRNHQKSNDPDLIDLLYKSKKINSGLPREDSKEKFRFQDWNDLIHSLNQFYRNTEKRKVRDEVFTIGETLNILDNEQDFKNVKVFLRQESKTKYSDSSNKLFLDDDNDKSIPIRIRKIIESNIVEDIEVAISELQEEITELKVDIEKCIAEKSKFQDEKNKKTNEWKVRKLRMNELIDPFENNLNIKNDQVSNASYDLNKLISLKNKKTSQHTSIESFDIDNKIENLKNKIYVYEKEQKIILNKVDELTQEILDMEKNNYKLIDDLSKKINEYTQEQNNLEIKYKNTFKNLNKNKMVFNYLTKNNVSKIYELKISSNYGTKVDKRSFKINNIFDSNNETLEKKGLDWIITNNDIGKIQVIRRYSASFTNINRGFYKNPYLFYSLLTIPEINKNELKKISKWNDVGEKTKTKYKLNEDQIKVVEKSINMRDIFYLQGPPGTGKTQTICAISEEYAIKNSNVLMTSSTHEAINNFFDRLNDQNLTNPNLILLKYRSNYPEENYGENTIYNLFLDKICNFTLNKKSGIDTSNLYNEYIEKFDRKCPEFPTQHEIELLRKYYNKHQNINIIESSRFKHIIDKFPTLKLNEAKSVDNFEYIIVNLYPSNIPEQLKVWSLITNDLENIVFDFSELENIFESKSSNIFEKIMKGFRRSLDNKEIMLNETAFLKYISENKLINIIGISTTSKTSFEILKNNINLFSEYPIDLVIIDEISKSTTPEILGRVILSKKVIFAGDYKQLPPITEFTEDECETFFDDESFEDFIDDKNINDPKQLYSFIEELHTTSFFKCEIESVKNNDSINTSNRPYHNLKIQHRFTKNIMNCVNEFYDDDEKLEMPTNPKKPNIYEIEHNNRNSEDDFSLIDTSWLSKGFIRELEGMVQLSDEQGLYRSFDSNQSIWNIKHQYPSMINDYNARVIIELINNFIKNNPYDKLIDKIGIICMTKSQKNVIIDMLKRSPNQNDINNLRIKIDTVDNFQGREKDIIIVDFVRSSNNLQNKYISNRPRNLKFYTVLERINVALSRAQSKLILVGAFENHYLDKKTVISGAEKMGFFKNVYAHAIKLDSVIKEWEGDQ